MGTHQFAGLACHNEGAGQVDIEDLAEHLDAGVEERRVAADAGGIDQTPDRAKTGLAAVQSRDHAGLILSLIHI